MIHPIRMVISTTAMNPPISGQYMEAEIYRTAALARAAGTLRVERDLLVGRRERPGHLQPALLAEHEPELARGPEPVGMGRSEGRTRAGL